MPASRFLPAGAGCYCGPVHFLSPWILVCTWSVRFSFCNSPVSVGCCHCRRAVCRMCPLWGAVEPDSSIARLAMQERPSLRDSHDHVVEPTADLVRLVDAPLEHRPRRPAVRRHLGARTGLRTPLLAFISPRSESERPREQLPVQRLAACCRTTRANRRGGVGTKRPGQWGKQLQR